MYTAKRSGSRRAVVYESSMHTDTVLDLELRHDLTHATRRGQLNLVYQPLIDLDTGRPVAVEALARWEHPRVGLVPPDVFIPMAERNGNIVDIGNWVLADQLRADRGLAGARTAGTRRQRQRVRPPAR